LEPTFSIQLLQIGEFSFIFNDKKFLESAMPLPPEIRASLGISHFRPQPGEVSLNRIVGDRIALLGWLEKQLGLSARPVPDADRILQAGQRLSSRPDRIYSASLAADKWGTASCLLTIVNELCLAGWTPETGKNVGPRLARELAEDLEGWYRQDEASRVAEVLASLREGQALPAFTLELEDSVAAWPQVWRPLLAQLNPFPVATAQALAGTANSLGKTQRLLLGAVGAPEAAFDRTISVHLTHSDTVACLAVGGFLAGLAPEARSTVVILCEDDSLATRLDGHLAGLGMPTMGATTISSALPELQLLPLVVAMCWHPIDPQVLIDFLALPTKPIPASAAWRLIEALKEQPGLGSGEWEKAVSISCRPENDPDGRVKERLESWFNFERPAKGSALSTSMLSQRCALLAQWAAGRALYLKQESPLAAMGLMSLAGKASTLGSLASGQGVEITEPQLSKMLENVMAQGALVRPFPATVVGPAHVRSLADITQPCTHLLWLGIGTAGLSPSYWPANELTELHDSGFDLDDGSRSLAARRRAERRGFAMVQESLIVFSLPGDREKRVHPLWQEITAGLADSVDRVAPLEDHVRDAADGAHLAPGFRVGLLAVAQPQPRRPLWTVPAGLVADRTKTSYSELLDKLGCRLKWFLKYQAKLYPSRIARLPEDHQLKGKFLHGLIELFFSGRDRLPDAAEAEEAAGRLFNDRIGLDASPLAQPRMAAGKHELRKQFVHAVKELITTLKRGGCLRVDIEVPMKGEAFGKQLSGSIDCLASYPDGQEAVLDLKYSTEREYRERILNGTAFQLAVYCHDRQASASKHPNAGYQILTSGTILSPSRNPIPGVESEFLLDGSAISSTWEKFSDIVNRCEELAQGGELISALPLLPVEDWPPGIADTILVTNPDRHVQPPCKYCDFRAICGLEELK
jgi:hypothetical protein